jgi:hypothetical protein
LVSDGLPGDAVINRIPTARKEVVVVVVFIL